MNLSANRFRWAILIVLCLIGASIAAAGMGWTGYVQSWIGAIFKAASGGALGYVVSRFVIGLDLSAHKPEDRPLVGLSQSLLIGFGALAVASGV